MNPSITRRTALALMGASTAAALPARVLALTPPLPWLATPQQIAAERMLLTLLEDPEIKRIQADVHAEIAAWPRTRAIPDAAATLDGAIAQWTNAVIFSELIKDTARPAFLWAVDDTPRDWLGHHLGGVGMAGDNPDAVYRTAGIEGGGRYEIIGRYHSESRPTQLLLEVNAGDMARPSNIMPTAGGAHQDIRNAGRTNDRELVVDASGSFRITLSPASAAGGGWASPNHMPIPETGFASIAVRDILADWKLRPCQLQIRRLDTVGAPEFGIEDVRKLVHRDLAGFIRFWAKFPEIWFGGLKPNTHSALQQRPGGWGYVVGVNYHLADDEALIMTVVPGGAKYTGFQINDPWMIQPDVRIAQVSLNTAQVTPNADGSITYVVARSDPGAANWLDTAGYRDGLAVVRWQQIPDGLKGDGLVRDFRVVKLGDVAAIKDLPRVTAAERQARIAARKADYETRVR